jgi:serine protease Do
MQSWKSAALTSALAVAVAGTAVTAVVHAQKRERPFVRAVADIMGGGAQIGVTVKEVETDAAKPAGAGVVVEEVETDSPAAKAGIKAGDTITEFDGERVRSVRQFARLVRETPAGRKVTAALTRDGQRVTVSVAPEQSSGFRFGDDLSIERWDDGGRSWSYSVPAPPAPPAAPAPPRAPRPPDVPEFDFGMFGRGGRLGISVETLTPQLEEYFGVKDGVLVRSVTDGSAAAKAGLKAGDVITAVNGSQVSAPSDVTRAINRLDEGAEFSIEIVRDKKTQRLKGKMEPREERSRTRARTVV